METTAVGTAHRTLVVADFTPLYPPYIWIPAFAGMTGQVQQNAAEGLGVSLNPKYEG